MILKPIHHVFNVGYNGVARELYTEAVIQDPLTQKHLRLKRVIWDTGATSSAINTTIAQDLGLKPTGQVQIHTANGTAIANTYVINFQLPNKVGIEGLNVSEGNLGPNTEMLVGMDVIAIGDFTVQNYAGQTHFSFCIPAFENKYSMIEKAETINPKNHKHNLKISKRP